MVSTTIASVTEFEGKDNTPLTFKLVVVTEVPTAVLKVILVKLALVLVKLVVLTLAGLKLVAASVVKKALVDVIEVAKKTVDVMAVPLAVVKKSGPVKVPPASGK